MEISGQFFGCNIGLVNQTTHAASGATVAYKMRRAEINDAVPRVPTGNNMSLGFDSAIKGLRKAMIRIEALVDDTANLVDLNFALFSGLYIRLAFSYNAAAGAGTGVVVSTDPVWLFPAALILSSTWSPDAEQAQPITLEVESYGAFSSPGETAVAFTF